MSTTTPIPVRNDVVAVKEIEHGIYLLTVPRAMSARDIRGALTDWITSQGLPPFRHSHTIGYRNFYTPPALLRLVIEVEW